MNKGKFKVDEIAILSSPIRLKHLQGEEVQIIQQEEPYKKDGYLRFWYTVQVLKTGDIQAAGEHQLTKLEHPNTPSTWDKCLWKPKK